MTIPRFELPDFDRRSRWGWWLVVVLLSLQIIGTTTVYFDRDPDEVLMKSYVMSDSVPLLGGSSADKAELEAALSRIERGPQTDRSALKSTAIRDLLGQPPRSADLNLLRVSKYEAYRTVAEIYGSEQLKADRAKQIAEGLGSEPFSLQIAKQRAYEMAGLEPTARESSEDQLAVAGAILFFVLLTGVGVWVWFFTLRSRGLLVPAGLPGGTSSPSRADRLAALAGLSLTTWVVSSLAFSLVGLRLNLAAAGILAGTLLLVVVAALVERARIGEKRVGLRNIGLDRPRLAHLKAALVALPPAWVCILLVAVASQFFFMGMPPPEHPISVELGESQSVWNLVGIFVMACVLAPLWEEITFRGLLLPAFESAFRSPTAGIVLSSLCFAAVHPTGIPAWPMLATVGAALALIYRQTGSLWPAIFLHGLHNALTLGLALTAVP